MIQPINNSMIRHHHLSTIVLSSICSNDEVDSTLLVKFTKGFDHIIPRIFAPLK